jgi:hypothetical protein
MLQTFHTLTDTERENRMKNWLLKLRSVSWLIEKNTEITEDSTYFTCTIEFLIPYRRSRKGLLVYLWSVRLSVHPSVCHSTFSFPDFSLQWMKIFNWNLIYDYILMSYRPRLSLVTLDQLLTELFPLMFTFSFLDFFFALDEVRNLKFFIWLPLE